MGILGEFQGTREKLPSSLGNKKAGIPGLFENWGIPGQMAGTPYWGQYTTKTMSKCEIEDL